jgi:hypothetical protein
MKEKPLGKDNSELQEILKRYENLKKGRSHSYIDEESFEKIMIILMKRRYQQRFRGC